MRRDRTGEPVDDDQEVLGGHRCKRGWIDRFEGQPRPCPECRPWLAETPPRPPTADELAAFVRRYPVAG